MKNSCLEERVFFRAISGLHSSISIHLSSQFPIQNSFLKTFEPNLEEFQRRFDHAKGQLWLRNLFFVYLLESRAISKHSSFWLKFLFYTGNTKEDEVTKELLSDIIDNLNKIGQVSHLLFED